MLILKWIYKNILESFQVFHCVVLDNQKPTVYNVHIHFLEFEIAEEKLIIFVINLEKM